MYWNASGLLDAFFCGVLETGEGKLYLTNIHVYNIFFIILHEAYTVQYVNTFLPNFLNISTFDHLIKTKNI